MKRATPFAMLATLVVIAVAIGAVARAAQRTEAADTSDRHTPRAHVHATAGAPGESQAAPPRDVDEGREPRPNGVVKPEAIDWGNPYDLMLHGIKPGKTHDMR
jgi:hypothetical protein